MKKTALIAAANDSHFPLLEELLVSLHDQAPQGALEDIALCVLDLGLTEARKDTITRLTDKIVEPGWDIDFPGREEMPGWFRAMTARPFLPDYFPGHQVYLWLDADTWVQDFSAVELLIEAGDRFGFGIVPEIDRSYGPLYGLGNAGAHADQCNRLAFGEEIGAKLSALPLLNSGVLAIGADCGIWATWRSILSQSLQRTAHKLVEQAALNLTVYQGGLPVHYLPAVCNWLCVHGPPRLDLSTKRFVEPYLPFQPLGILHLTALTETTLKTFTTDGRTVEVSLRYKDRTSAFSSM